MDIKLDANGDIDLETTPHDATLISGAAAIRQHLQIRLLHFMGEWFLDRRTGVPYYEQILVKGISVQAIEFIFRRVVQTTPGIRQVTALQLALDGPARKLTVVVDGKLHDWVGDADQGFHFVFEELILPQRNAAQKE